MSMTISSSVGSHHEEALKAQLPVVHTEIKGDTLKVTALESLTNLKLVVPALKNTKSEHPELKRIELDFSPVYDEALRSRELALAHISPILCHLLELRERNPEISVEISGLSEALQNSGGIRIFSGQLDFKDPIYQESPLKQCSFGLGRGRSSPPSAEAHDTFTLKSENGKLTVSFPTSPIGPSDISNVISSISKFDQELVIDLRERDLAGWNGALALIQIGHRCEKDAGKLTILVDTESSADKLLEKISVSKQNAKYLGEIIRI